MSIEYEIMFCIPSSSFSDNYVIDNPLENSEIVSVRYFIVKEILNYL